MRTPMGRPCLRSKSEAAVETAAVVADLVADEIVETAEIAVDGIEAATEIAETVVVTEEEIADREKTPIEPPRRRQKRM
jgi:chaperonin GroEL (HSP60 family)